MTVAKTRSPAVLLTVAGAVFVGSCATIETKTTQSDRVVAREKSQRRVRGSERYAVAAEAAGSRLVLTVTEARECELLETPILLRRETVERTMDSSSSQLVGWGGGLGLLTAGYGSYVALNPEAAARDYNKRNPSEKARTAGDYRDMGVGFAVLGAAAVAWALVEVLRAGDTERNIGRVRGSAEVSRFSCDERRVIDADVTISTGPLENEVVTTNADGRAVLDVSTLSPVFVSAPAAAWRARVSGSQPLTLDGQAIASAKGEAGAIAAGQAEAAVAKGDLRKARDLIVFAKALGAAPKAASEALAVAEQHEKLERNRPVIERHIKAAQGLSSQGKLEEAKTELRHAADLGAEVDPAFASDLKTEFSRIAKRHLRNASERLRAHAFDEADNEAEMAGGLGVDVAGLRAAIESARKASASKTLSSLLAECRKISRTRVAFGRLDRCDEQCQQILVRVNADLARLTERLSGLSLSWFPEEEQADVNGQCQRAGCPVCPQ